jgi:hypothetical protein
LAPRSRPPAPTGKCGARGTGSPAAFDAEALAWYRAVYDDDEASDELVLARLDAWDRGQSLGPDVHGIPRRHLDEALARLWVDPQATLGGVVAPGSCTCGVNEAETVLNSPRWGAWDVCRPCGTEQLAVLRGADIAAMTRPDLIKAEALRCIQLDWMLRV